MIEGDHAELFVQLSEREGIKMRYWNGFKTPKASLARSKVFHFMFYNSVLESVHENHF